MAQLSKQALKVGNNTSFPNNNTNYITPAILREFNTDMIDSLVDENTYNVDSASWNAEIAAISASATVNTGSLLLTASVNLNTITFTKGDASQFFITVDTGSATDISELNAFTQSQDSKNSTLATYTASLDNSITELNSSTASLFTSASLALTTASFDNGTRNLTFTKGDNEIFSVNIPDASGSAGDFVTTSSFNAYTSSNDQRVGSLEAATSSYAISASVAAVDAAQQAQIDSLIAATASYADSASFAASQLAQDIRIDGLAALTASVSDSISNLNLFTQSADQRLDSIEAQSGSWVTSAITASSIITASVNNDDITFTKGDGSQFTIQVATGSFAATASLAQDALDIVVDVKNTTGAQINKGTVVRIIGATGDNPLIQTASWEDDANSANTLGFVVTDIPNDAFGRVITQGTLLSIDTDPALGYAAGQLIYLSSSGQYTNVVPPAPYHEVRLGQVLRAQQNNGSIYVLVQNGYELSELHDVNISTGSLVDNDLLAYNSASGQWENKTLTQVGAALSASFNSYTQSNDQRVGSLEAATSSYVTEAITGSSLITASVSLNTITFTKGDASTFDITVDTGSGGGTTDITELNAFTASQLLINTDYNSFTASADSRLGNLEAATGSYIATASANLNTITFTKVDTSTFDITLSGTTIDTGSFATTGSNSFQAAQEITGALSVTGQIFTEANIVANQSIDAYGLLYANSGAEVFNTLNVYGATNITGSLTVTGSVFIDGNIYADNLTGSAADLTELNAFTASQLLINTDYDLFTASADSRLGNLEAVTGSNLITASINNSTNTITFTKADTSTFDIIVQTGSISGIDTGSFATTGSNSFQASQEITGGLNVTDQIFTNANITVNQVSNLYGVVYAFAGAEVYSTLIVYGETNISGTLTASLSDGYVWVGDSTGKTYEVPTSSFGGGGSIPAGTISGSQQITDLGFVSSSITASSLITASVSLNTITFTKGDESTFQLTVDTGSGGGGGGVSFPYSGSVEITGSVKVQPFTLTVSSNTASINMNESNYFILNLPTSSTTHVTFTNINPGESINLLVSQSATVATGSITFAPNILFPNGNDYQATATGSAADIVSFVSFTTSQVFASQVKNLY